jgi:predicted amidohydrolase
LEDRGEKVSITRRQLLAGLPLVAPAILAQTPPVIYDLVLKNGDVLDPKNNRRGRMDIAVVGDKIVRVGPNIPASHAKLVVEVGDYYVTPGLIDIRTHFDALGEGVNVQPDHNALTNGVTTAVTTGSPKGARGSRTRLLQWGEGMPVMKDTADGLRPGDILSGMYGPKAPPLEDLRKRGVLLDTGSFSFRVAAPAIQKGFLPDTISTDIQKDNILLTRANMMTTLSKFLNLGMTLEQLVERTTVNPAKAIRRPELGHLSEGSVADIAVLEMRKGKFGFVDAGLSRLAGDRKLRCVLTVRAGRVVWDSEGLSMTEWTHAGPYSNFK